MLLSLIVGILAVVPLTKCQGIRFVPFAEYLHDIYTASYAEWSYDGIHGEASFKGIKSFILDSYGGVKDPDSVYSFFYDDTYTDCLPIMEQPAVHTLNLTDLPKPPPDDIWGDEAKIHANYTLPTPLIHRGLKDIYGKAVTCGKDTVPIPRLSLEDLIKSPTLDNIFAPLGDAFRNQRPQDQAPFMRDDPVTGVYVTGDSLTQRQDPSRRYGGRSIMNIWRPLTDPFEGRRGSFSESTTSQQWFYAHSPLASVEGGWVVRPSSYGGSPEPHLFVASHQESGHCINCRSFVVTGHWRLGERLDASDSTRQMVLDMRWRLYDGTWWLFLNNEEHPSIPEAAGFFPGSVFPPNTLTLGNTKAYYGGFAITGSDPNKFPEMGSGAFADEATDDQRVAWHKHIEVYESERSIGMSEQSLVRNTENGARRHCYRGRVVNGGHLDGTAVYFGGPGGRDCQAG